MNRITDLSTKDLLKLTPEDINTYVQIELMHEGIVIPPLPQKPEQFNLAPTVTVYQIHSNGKVLCTLPSNELALAVLEAGQNAFMTEDYLYEAGYDRKFMSKVEDLSIISVKVYDEHELRRYTKELKQSKDANDAYNSARREYDKINNRAIEITERVNDVVRFATKQQQKATEISNTFSKYTQLANGDYQVALNFLLKAYSQEEIDEANELLSDDEKVSAAGK